MKLIKKITTSKFFKTVSVTMAVACVMALGCVTAFAEDPANISTALTNAFNTVAADIGSYALIAIPAAAGIFAIFFGVRRMFAFFKSLAK